MVKEEIEEYINSHASEEKANFDRGLIETRFEIKGLKMKDIDDFAKRLVKMDINFKELPLDNHEEIVLAGCYIGHSKFSAKEKISLLSQLLPYIDNWASCDCVVSRLKNVESEREFFASLLKGDKPFYNRVGIVWLMRYQLKNDLKNVVELISHVKSDHFYVKMAKAWAYAEAFIYDFEFMYEFTKKIDDSFIKNKTIQKACESFRISSQNKEKLKELRVKRGNR